jgi:hypothetical protein
MTASPEDPTSTESPLGPEEASPPESGAATAETAEQNSPLPSTPSKPPTTALPSQARQSQRRQSQPPSGPVEGERTRNPLKRLVRWPFQVRDDVEQRWGNITQEWDRISGSTIARYLFLIKIVLLHARYIFGYLAAGFLVSAPLYLGTKMFGNLEWDQFVFGRIFYSILTGVICIVPFILLIPLTRIEWENMRVPEFKIFELALTRWASYISFAYLVISFYVNAIFDKEPTQAWWFDLQIAWINFTLMVSAWLRIKIQTLIFKDFYDLEEKEDLILQRKFEGHESHNSSAIDENQKSESVNPVPETETAKELD